MVMAETQISPESRWLSAPVKAPSSPPGLRRLRFSFFTINLSKSKIRERHTRRFDGASETTKLPPDETGENRAG